MIPLAGFSLLVALIVGTTASGLGVYAAASGYRPAYRVVRRSLYALPLLLGLACGVMVTGFLNDWMTLEYVANNSSRDLAFLYKVTGLWAGQSGSLLFWAFVLAVYGVLLVAGTRDRPPNRFYAVTLTTLTAILTFFLFLLNGVTYPFNRLWELPDGSIVSAVQAPSGAELASGIQGAGLNPVLQHPGMAIHPPMLYLGYIGLGIPFCFAVGALASGRLGEEWIRQSRVWTLFAWSILSFGIVLGGWWAYQELGWGGYWAWDPVENASLMPWLMATAFVHSIMIQRQRGMLKRWNVVLVCLAFLLTIFGTFLTRSGLLDSVHTFAEDPVVGTAFLSFIGVLALGVFGMVAYRYEQLESRHQLQSIFSREFAFILNNLLLVGICFAVLWGTVYPVLSEWITGERVSVGPAFFNQVTIPMFLVLLLMTGVGPLISWRRASLDNLVRNFTLPAVTAGLVALGMVLAGFFRWLPILSFAICGFVATTVIMEFYRGGMARRRSTGEPFPVALLKLTWKARSRFGGYVVHLGVVLMVVGITASSAYGVDREATLTRGETLSIRQYELTYRGLSDHPVSNGTRVNANLDVRTQDQSLGRLRPGLEILNNTEQPRARVDIRSTWKDDLYVVLAGWTDEGAASVHVYHNPLVNWIWIGVLVLLMGGLYAFLPL